ncbi:MULTISPECIES: restriction endonuclease subunit S [unclassified Endozoicomonas]|uniref:restriction endonuclease subunit S n=1 Tax=unclassified Endozoicomonas TaxID=2644528 RepID=UPI002147F413|nr:MULTISPECIES: restriction endonuclease subunit S [unclassified Endozoicomonas]
MEKGKQMDSKQNKKIATFQPEEVPYIEEESLHNNLEKYLRLIFEGADHTLMTEEEALRLITSSETLYYRELMRSAEQRDCVTDGYKALELSVSSLAELIKFASENKDAFSKQLSCRADHKSVEVTLESAKYLGRSIEQIAMDGADPMDALYIRGTKGRSKPIASARNTMNRQKAFRSGVAALVDVIKATSESKVIDIHLEVADLLDMKDKENTIKKWHDTYKIKNSKLKRSVLKREIPVGWGDGTMDKLGQIVGGSTPSTKAAENFCQSGTPWITPNDLSNNTECKFISRGAVDVSSDGIKSASLKKYPKGTVLLSSRAPIGYMAIARNEVTTNQGFKSLMPSKGYSSEFIFYAVQNCLKAIIQYSSGSTFKEISGTVLKTVKVRLPSEHITDKYTRQVESIFKRQDMLEQESQQLAKLRDWLLPMQMNGQVTVK